MGCNEHLPDSPIAERLDCGNSDRISLRNRHAKRIPITLSMEAGTPSLPIHAYSTENHDERVNWPPLGYLACRRSQAFGHPAMHTIFALILYRSIGLDVCQFTFSCCICNFIWIVFFLSLHRLFWNQTRITRGDRPVISTSCSFISASGRGFAL